MSAMALRDALLQRRTIRDFGQRNVDVAIVRRLLWAAQGVTDEAGNRTAPSAHALHPLKLMVVAAKISGLGEGLYAVDRDTGEMSLVTDRDLRGELETSALEEQPWIGSAAGIVTICADILSPSSAFADQPPLGFRGQRYVYMEAGAAAQNLQLQVVSEGLGCVMVGGFSDEPTAASLELQAPYAPLLHLCFGWPRDD